MSDLRAVLHPDRLSAEERRQERDFDEYWRIQQSGQANEAVDQMHADDDYMPPTGRRQHVLYGEDDEAMARELKLGKHPKGSAMFEESSDEKSLIEDYKAATAGETESSPFVTKDGALRCLAEAESDEEVEYWKEQEAKPRSVLPKALTDEEEATLREERVEEAPELAEVRAEVRELQDHRQQHDAALQDAAIVARGNAILVAEQAFARQQPDYHAAVQHAADCLARDCDTHGIVDAEERRLVVQGAVKTILAIAEQCGVNPAELLYRYSEKVYGWKPTGQLEKLSKMSDGEFKAATSKKALAKTLMPLKETLDGRAA